MTTEDVTVLRHTSTAITFNLPSGISLDDKDEPISFTVTHNDEPIDTFEVKDISDKEKNASIQKVFDEIDFVDGGNYVITVDIGRQQFVHKLAVSVRK